MAGLWALLSTKSHEQDVGWKASHRGRCLQHGLCSTTYTGNYLPHSSLTGDVVTLQRGWRGDELAVLL